MNKKFYTLRFFILFLTALTCSFSTVGQMVYVTSSGGCCGTEKWMSITTGPNDTGTQVWLQGGSTPSCGTTNGGGLVSDIAVDVSGFCGQTLYLNAYDRWDDSWDGTTYEIWTAAGQTGTLLANNGGADPDDGNDDDSGSNWCDTFAEELESSESFTAPACPCNGPTAIYTLVPNCPSSFSVNVDVTTNDASGVDITDDDPGTSHGYTNAQDGISTMGPYALGTNVVITIDGTPYGCGGPSSSSAITEDCACPMSPSATTGTTNLNCGSNTYDIEVTVDDYGSGTDANIEIDGSVVQNNANLGQLYTFTGYATGSHTVTIDVQPYSSYATCETDYVVSNSCNGGETCAQAVDILGVSSTADLTTAIRDAPAALTPCSESVGNGNTLSLGDCSGDGCFEHSAYWYTDYKDLWYVIDIPDGTDEFSVHFTGLSCAVAVFPYTSSCGSLSLMSLTGGVGTGLADSDNDGMIETAANQNPFINTDGVIHFKGAEVATASTSPIYLRVFAHDDKATGTACNSSDIVACSFTIEATSPQANDACANAIDVTTNHTGASWTGNISLASQEDNDEWDCSGTLLPQGDLWFDIQYPDFPSEIVPFYVELTVDGPTGSSVTAAIYDVTTSCGGITTAARDACETLTFSSPVTTTFGDLETNDNFQRELQIIPNSPNMGNITVSAVVTAVNTSCEWFQGVGAGFDITTARTVDFNWSSDSGADPVTSGSDLWYQFDPNTGSDGFHTIYSTSADIIVSGLNPGEELTFLLYQGNTVSGNNCTDLAGDHLSTITIDADGTHTEAISCLDEWHGPANGGYLLRIVQTAGGTTASPTVTITPGPVGPSNNDCSNVWDGNGPAIGPTDNPNSDMAHDWNQFWIFDGETVSGNFTGANDCDNSGLCNAVDYEAIDEKNDRDMWYVFDVPDNECSTLGLTQSTVVENMDITYDAGEQTHDAILYVYSDCGDGNLLDCSGALDGAGTTWTINGLTQGESYLMRVKPWDISTSNTAYPFDITVNNGVARPCNDKKGDAWSLPVQSCPDYDALETWTMRGADDEETFSTYDVWFKFTTPVTPNGGPYFNPDKQWVTVFFEGVSNHSYRLKLYQAGGTAVATGALEYTTSGAGDRVWCKFGHLEPSTEYVIRLEATESETEINNNDVEYKIEINAGPAVTTPLTCGDNESPATTAICGSCGDVPLSIPSQFYEDGNTTPPSSAIAATETLCEEWYKVDLPPGTPGNMYWVAEVRGFDQVLDFELRSQYIDENSANEGGPDDFDHPCSSRSLEPDADFVASYNVDYQVEPGASYTNIPSTNPHNQIGSNSCEDLGGGEPHGGGYKKIYKNLNGPITGQKDYYYLRVFMDPDDPNYVACSQNGTETINVCEVVFKGPYTTEALAVAGGTPDAGDCTPASISGKVFFDNYGDGTEGNNAGDGTGSDAPIPGITVELYGPGCNPCTDVTDASGNYTFDNLADGDYYVKFLKGAYDEITGQNLGGNDTEDSDPDPTTGETATITIGTGNKIVNDVDAGLYDHATITGTLYENYDPVTGNGVDVSPNVTVDILVTYCVDRSTACTGANLTTITYSVTTDANGYYEITDAVPGVITNVSAIGYTFEEASVIDSETSLASNGTQTEQDFALPTPLPVELISFYARESGDENLLEWYTATEENTLKFIIERSEGGADRFEAIGEVFAIGFSDVVQQYSFVDEAPVERSYYRLKILDIDGYYEYSDIKVVQRTTSFDKVTVVPNPTRNVVDVHLRTSSKEDIEIKVVNVLGTQLHHMVKSGISGSVSTRFDLDGQPEGIYFLIVWQGKNTYIERIVKIE